MSTGEFKNERILFYRRNGKLNFISPHTLRYYDKIDLLKPSYINEETGYRYYSYKDFLFLDAVQYLRYFDMSLEEPKNNLRIVL